MSRICAFYSLGERERERDRERKSNNNKEKKSKKRTSRIILKEIKLYDHDLAW